MRRDAIYLRPLCAEGHRITPKERGLLPRLTEIPYGRTLPLHHRRQPWIDRALRAGLFQALGDIAVDSMHLLGGVLSLGLFIYLLFAMLFPERIA
jgi:K+-transporting ATPase KdpF subunit